MKRVLITGCSSGIGEILVGKFLREGWETWATLRNLGARSTTFQTLQQEFGTKLKVIELDVTSLESRDKIAAQLATTDGLDCLVNNAGFGLFGAAEDTPEAQLRAQFETNFFGATQLTCALLPALRKKQGHVIGLSSFLGFNGMPMSSAYSASKFALEGWLESLAFEVRPFGVKVTIIEPGAHRTRFSKNMQWAEGSDLKTSAYYEKSQSFKIAQQKMSQRPNPQQPDAIAQKILTAANQKNPPLRILCGKDAKAGYFLRRILPAQMFFNLMQTMYKKVLSPENKNISAKNAAQHSV